MGEHNAGDLIFSMATLIIGGIVGLGFKIIWDWLNKKSNGNGKEHKMPDECRSQLGVIQQHTNWLKEAHDRCDENGIPLWFVPRELIKILQELREDRRDQKTILQQIAKLLEGNQQLLVEIKDR